MNGDATTGTLLFYVFMLLAFGILCFLSKKTNNIIVLLTGNALSTLSSHLFILHYQTEKWGWYFKPFTPDMLLIVISVVALSLQLFFIHNLRSKLRN